MKNAIVLALLLMRMASEQIVKEEEGNQPQIYADERQMTWRIFAQKNQRAAHLLHRPEIGLCIFRG
jgi:hypothetical protein